jgi:hypothetical protein
MHTLLNRFLQNHLDEAVNAVMKPTDYFTKDEFKAMVDD